MKIFYLLAFLMATLAWTLPAFSAEPAERWELSIGDGSSDFKVPPGLHIQPLVKVTTDRNKDIYALGLMLDEAGIAGGFYLQQQSGKAADDGQAFLFRDIAKGEGVTLLQSDGRKIVTMKGSWSQARSKGAFRLTYLKNGLWGTHRSCDAELIGNGEEFWMRNVYTGGKVTEMKVLTTSLGVKTLEGICPD